MWPNFGNRETRFGRSHRKAADRHVGAAEPIEDPHSEPRVLVKGRQHTLKKSDGSWSRGVN